MFCILGLNNFNGEDVNILFCNSIDGFETIKVDFAKLEILAWDCFGEEPKVICDCCPVCCDGGSHECHYAS